MKNSQKKNLWKNLEWKIVAIILFTTVTLAASFYTIIYDQYYKLTINNLKADAETVSEYAVEVIYEECFTTLNSVSDESSDMYKDTQVRMNELRHVANIRYLYTAKQDADGTYIYVLDGLNLDAEDFRHIGDPIEEEIIPALAECLSGKVVLGDSIMVTDWGIVYVTYFPVYSPDGDVIGAIGMEFDCEDLYYALNQVTFLTVGITIAVAALCIILAVAIVKKVVRNTESVIQRKDEALVAATEAAQKSSNAKSEFLSRMSHEIRTPMNAIIGMTAIAESAGDEDRAKYCLSVIKASSAQLLGLINDILDMSQIEKGNFDLDMAPLNLEDMITKAESLVMDKAIGKNQMMNISIENGVKRNYIGDELRITQVIGNLLSNAVKFTPDKGSISLDVVETGKTEDSTVLRFTVTDTGIGISEGDLDKLFTSFEQGDGSMSRKFGGTGLGLAISKSVVEKMGGKVWVESELGRGSRFGFEIKLKDAECRADEPERETPDFSGVHMLLAEDIAINREVAISLLEDTNINIDTAENGVEAVEMFTADPEKYDIIIMDIQMPEMDGYEAVRTIRALDFSKAKSVPIIAMTANAFQEDIEKCLACGMNGHIAKPIDPDTVAAKIRDCLDKAKGGW